MTDDENDGADDLFEALMRDDVINDRVMTIVGTTILTTDPRRHDFRLIARAAHRLFDRQIAAQEAAQAEYDNSPELQEMLSRAMAEPSVHRRFHRRRQQLDEDTTDYLFRSPANAQRLQEAYERAVAEGYAGDDLNDAERRTLRRRRDEREARRDEEEGNAT